MAGSGYRAWAFQEAPTSANIQSYLQDQTVMRFASAAARTSAITSPTEGMVSYLDDTNAIEVYTGAAWYKPWNMPWGYITNSTGSAAGTVLRAGVAATAVLLHQQSVTHTANRRVRATAYGKISWTTAVTSELYFVLSGGQEFVNNLPAHTANGTTVTHYFTSTGSAQACQLWGQFGGNNSNVTLTTTAPWMLFEDIGPA